MSRAAMQQALEALEMSSRFVYTDNRPECEAAIAALRAALAEQAQPVAWYDQTNKASDQAFAYQDVRDKWPHIYKVPLYTIPPAPQPLTNDETMVLLNDTAGAHWCDEAHIQRFRRAVEAAVLERMGVQR